MLRQGTGDRCLDCDPTTKKLFTNTCDRSIQTMKWHWASVNRTGIEQWKSEGA